MAARTMVGGRKRAALTLSLLLSMLLGRGAEAGASSSKRSKKERPAQSSPFWLMDMYHEVCLRPDGFGACDVDALWVQVPRGKKWQTSLVSLIEGDPKASCLERVGGGQERQVRAGRCSKAGSKRWEVVGGKGGGYYVTEGTGNKRHCLVRGSTKDKAMNVVTTQECRKAGTQLRRTVMPINMEGFFLQALDGKCFDGETFRTCNPRDRTQIFGLGIDFIGGKEATRSFFHYGNPEACITRVGRQVQNGECKGSGAIDWSLEDGMLMHAQNKQCLVRLTDNTAEMRPCKQGVYEYISMIIAEKPEKVEKQFATSR